jgi:Tfp pilus assembly PilM family ATPase
VPEAASDRKDWRKNLQFRIKKPLSLKKSVIVGIDLGYDDLKLAKIAHASAHKHQLIDYIQIPYEPGLNSSNPEFPKFLKKHLNRFCRGAKSPQLWSTISSARVELRYLRIPKVPPKQIANAVYWSHRKVAPYDEGESIFDYILLGEQLEDGVPKLGVVSFTVPRHEIQFHKELFVKSGYPLTGISIIPFAIQNLFRARWIRDEVKTVSSLYIGRDWSRIDVYSRGSLVLSRGIKAGIKTMLEAMRGELSETETDNRITLPPELIEEAESVSEAAEAHRKFDSAKAQQIFFGLIHDSAAASENRGRMQPEEEEIYQLILPALSRLVQQVERTFEHYTAHFGNEQVRKIYISSGIRPHRRIVDYIGDELGLPREVFDPFKTPPENLDDVDPPKSANERGAFTPAIGMALSSNANTPNFLFTYKEKAKAAQARMMNKAAMIGFFLVLAACLGFYGWQQHLVAKKEQKYEQLQARLAAYQTRVDESLILKLVEQTRHQNAQMREYSRRFLGTVVLTEISNRTPSNIRLTNISVLLAENPPTPAAAKGKKPPEPQRLLSLEGIILEERAKMETTLAGYLLKLSDSPLFSSPQIASKEVGFFYDKEVLRFTAQLKLL